MSGDHQGISRLDEPTQACSKAQYPTANGRQGPGLRSPWSTQASVACPCPLPKMNEVNVMLPYSGKEEPVLPARDPASQAGA